MTGHAFQVLLTDQAVHQALGAVRAVLSEGGRFAFETRNPLAREWESWTPERYSEVIDEGGHVVRMARQVQAFDGSLLSFSHTFTSTDWPQAEVSRSTLRFLAADPLNAALVEARFSVEAQHGDWAGSPVSAIAPEIITIARLT